MTTTFIAILDLSVSAADRPAALAQLAGEQPIVRAMAGCVDFRLFPAPDSDTAITVLHEWSDQAAFDAYLSSDAFARSGAVLRPLMQGPPSSRRFRVELVEVVG
ncbi:MAG: putative quinol monooxygenase [Acidimicrobiales bacterium]